MNSMTNQLPKFKRESKVKRVSELPEESPLRQMCNFDYSKETDWFEEKFSGSQAFQPSQLNYVLLNSPIVSQFYRELGQQRNRKIVEKDDFLMS